MSKAAVARARESQVKLSWSGKSDGKEVTKVTKPAWTIPADSGYKSYHDGRSTRPTKIMALDWGETLEELFPGYALIGTIEQETYVRLLNAAISGDDTAITALHNTLSAAEDPTTKEEIKQKIQGIKNLIQLQRDGVKIALTSQDSYDSMRMNKLPLLLSVGLTPDLVVQRRNIANQLNGRGNEDLQKELAADTQHRIRLATALITVPTIFVNFDGNDHSPNSDKKNHRTIAIAENSSEFTDREAPVDGKNFLLAAALDFYGYPPETRDYNLVKSSVITLFDDGGTHLRTAHNAGFSVARIGDKKTGVSSLDSQPVVKMHTAVSQYKERVESERRATPITPASRTASTMLSPALAATARDGDIVGGRGMGEFDSGDRPGDGGRSGGSGSRFGGTAPRVRGSGTGLEEVTVTSAGKGFGGSGGGSGGGGSGEYGQSWRAPQSHPRDASAIKPAAARRNDGFLISLGQQPLQDRRIGTKSIIMPDNTKEAYEDKSADLSFKKLSLLLLDTHRYQHALGDTSTPKIYSPKLFCASGDWELQKVSGTKFCFSTTGLEANNTRRCMVQALQVSCKRCSESSPEISTEDAAKFILIAIKHGGISNPSSGNHDDVTRSIQKLFPGRKADQMYETAKLFSKSFQDMCGEYKIYTGNPNATTLVPLRLKRLDPTIVLDLLQTSRDANPEHTSCELIKEVLDGNSIESFLGASSARGAESSRGR